MEGMHVEVIGTLHSCFKEKFGTPRQGCLVKHSQGYIEIVKKWEPQNCLRGLEDFSHAWVVFWFHGNKNLSFRSTVSPPRFSSHRVGALASRSPMRPNPIGLSLVKIEKVVSPRIYISGIDMIEGTPIIDIKPYIHSYDSVASSTHGWLDEVQQQEIEVCFSIEALEQIALHPNPHLQAAITEILRNDIRNRNDKTLKNIGKKLGFYFEDVNVVFYMEDHVANVVAVENHSAHRVKHTEV